MREHKPASNLGAIPGDGRLFVCDSAAKAKARVVGPRILTALRRIRDEKE